VKWNLSEGETYARIKMESGGMEKSKERAAVRKEIFAFMVASKKRREEILRVDMLTLWRPAMRAIALKSQQRKERGVLTDEHTELCTRLKSLTNLTEIEMILGKIDAIEEGIRVASLPLAFAKKARSEEELFRFQMAADYADAWCEIKASDGRLLGGFSAFYICQAGGVDSKCNTLMLSKSWTRNHIDPLACKQGWKCVCCGAGYKTKMGMMVETKIIGGELPLYALAPCSSGDDKDMHALILEDLMGDKVRTPEDLYEMIPEVLPSEGRFIRKAVPDDFWGGATGFVDRGVYKILEMTSLRSMPQWDWEDVYHFFTRDDDCTEC
jgi:hypothetical protein